MRAITRLLQAQLSRTGRLAVWPSENIDKIAKRAVSDAQDKCFIRTSELVQKVSGRKSRCVSRGSASSGTLLLRSAYMGELGLGSNQAPDWLSWQRRCLLPERYNDVSSVRPENVLAPETSESRQGSHIIGKMLQVRSALGCSRFLEATLTGALEAPIGVKVRSRVCTARLPARFARLKLAKSIRQRFAAAIRRATLCG